MSAGLGAIGNLAFVMGLVKLSGYLHVESHLIEMRVAYGVSQALAYGFLWELKRRIIAKNDKTKITYTSQSPTSQGKKVTSTISEYDLEQYSAALKQHLISIALIMAIHLYGGYVQPLFLQIFMPWKTLLFSPLFKIHVLGNEATGELKRPWTQPSPFGAPPKKEEEEEDKDDKDNKNKIKDKAEKSDKAADAKADTKKDK